MLIELIGIISGDKRLCELCEAYGAHFLQVSDLMDMQLSDPDLT
jgi:hypothetical protein